MLALLAENQNTITAPNTLPIPALGIALLTFLLFMILLGITWTFRNFSHRH